MCKSDNPEPTIENYQFSKLWTGYQIHFNSFSVAFYSRQGSDLPTFLASQVGRLLCRIALDSSYRGVEKHRI